MMPRALQVTTIALVMSAAGVGWAQSSSLYHRGEQGEYGSNQPMINSAVAAALVAMEHATLQTAGAGEASADSAARAPATIQATDMAAPSSAPSAATTGLTVSALRESSASLAEPTAQSRRNAPASPASAALEQFSFTAIAPPEPRSFRVHDLVTIIVREETTYSSDAKTDLEKEYSLEAKLEKWLQLKLANLQITPTDLAGGTPEIKGSANRTFSGDGEVERNDKFIGRITAEIIDVKPNGTLLLAAKKQIKTDEDEQLFQLSGTCRADDVNADNTVLSTQLADLVVRKMHRGDVRDTTKRGLVPRIVDWFNPF